MLKTTADTNKLFKRITVTYELSDSSVIKNINIIMYAFLDPSIPPSSHYVEKTVKHSYYNKVLYKLR